MGLAINRIRMTSLFKDVELQVVINAWFSCSLKKALYLNDIHWQYEAHSLPFIPDITDVCTDEQVWYVFLLSLKLSVNVLLLIVAAQYDNFLFDNDDPPDTQAIEGICSLKSLNIIYQHCILIKLR